MNYLYDGTFEGFLTCVHRHYYAEKADDISVYGDYQLDLLRRAETVETDLKLAETVLAAIETKISKWDAERLYRAHCTSETDKEMKMLRYIRLGFKQGGKIRLLHGNPVVHAVQLAEQRLGAEVHRLCGLIRFSAIRKSTGSADEILYAEIDPDNDVLSFLAPHFGDRFRWDPFIIYDTRRGKALFGYNKEWEIVPFDSGTDICYSESEEEYRALWRKYFDIMATKERVNPKCQKRFMPIRYWKNLTEMQMAQP